MILLALCDKMDSTVPHVAFNLQGLRILILIANPQLFE